MTAVWNLARIPPILVGWKPRLYVWTQTKTATLRARNPATVTLVSIGSQWGILVTLWKTPTAVSVVGVNVVKPPRQRQPPQAVVLQVTSATGTVIPTPEGTKTAIGNNTITMEVTVALQLAMVTTVGTTDTTARTLKVLPINAMLACIPVILEMDTVTERGVRSTPKAVIGMAVTVVRIRVRTVITVRDTYPPITTLGMAVAAATCVVLPARTAAKTQIPTAPTARQAMKIG